MEHKFIIEVRLKHEPPKTGPHLPCGKTPAPVFQGNMDPKVLNQLLAQLPHALAALQRQPNPQVPKK